MKIQDGYPSVHRLRIRVIFFAEFLFATKLCKHERSFENFEKKNPFIHFAFRPLCTHPQRNISALKVCKRAYNIRFKRVHFRKGRKTFSRNRKWQRPTSFCFYIKLDLWIFHRVMQISHLSDPSGPFSAHRVGSFKDPFHVCPYTLSGNVHIHQ